MDLLLRLISGLRPSAKISVADLSLPSEEAKRIEMLQESAADVAFCREIFTSWQEKIDEQLSTKKPKLNKVLQDFRHNVTVLSDHYVALTTSCGDLAEAGIGHSGQMIELIDYIVSSNGPGDELRDRLTAVTKKGDALSQTARTLQDKFRFLNERLESFRQNLEVTKLELERKKRKEEWWQRFFEVAISFLAALSIVMGAVGIVATLVATAPVGIAIGGGLVAAAAVTGTLAEGVQFLIDLTKNGKSSPESRLTQVINVITSIEQDIPKVADHVSALEVFCSQQGNTFSSLTDQDKRIKFSGGAREMLKLQESKREWQNVQASFKAYQGLVQAPVQTISYKQSSSSVHLSH